MITTLPRAPEISPILAYYQIIGVTIKFAVVLLLPTIDV
jgi:hypothetical protein